jgi:glycosyltransferase involved in cell wall biosynthesis
MTTIAQHIGEIIADHPVSRVGLTVIVPCFNEEEGIATCHERLTAVLRQTGLVYEILYVDDGSRDHTLQILTDLYAIDPSVTVVELSRNFGHQAAVSAGLEIALGEAVMIIDSDLQDPPELIPRMLALRAEGYEVVYGVRSTREGETGFKLWTAKAFYRLINSLSDVDIPLDTGDFRLLDRKAVDAMNALPERHRLLRGMSSWIGFRQYGLKYARSARFAGTTKYPLRKMLNLALDGIASFSVVPLRLVTLTGFLTALISVSGIFYSLFVKLFTNTAVRGWTMMFIGQLFLGGIQMLSIGVLGEYIGRIYTESKQRPLYLARQVLRRPTSKRNLDEANIL